MAADRFRLAKHDMSKGHRRRRDQKGLCRGALEVFCSCPIVVLQPVAAWQLWAGY